MDPAPAIVRSLALPWSCGGFVFLGLRAGAWTKVAITDPQLGTLRGWVNANGADSVRLFADSAKGVWGATDTSVVRFRFAGAEYDQETGLYYMRARYYDPALGRFLSEDPIGIDGGLNLYAYAGNDPTNRSDPSGLFGDPEDPNTKAVDLPGATVTGSGTTFPPLFQCHNSFCLGLRVPRGDEDEFYAQLENRFRERARLLMRDGSGAATAESRLGNWKRCYVNGVHDFSEGLSVLGGKALKGTLWVARVAATGKVLGWRLPPWIPNLASPGAVDIPWPTAESPVVMGNLWEGLGVELTAEALNTLGVVGIGLTFGQYGATALLCAFDSQLYGSN